MFFHFKIIDKWNVTYWLVNDYPKFCSRFLFLRFGLHYGQTVFSKLCMLRYFLFTIFRKEHCFYNSDFNLSQL